MSDIKTVQALVHEIAKAAFDEGVAHGKGAKNFCGSNGKVPALIDALIEQMQREAVQPAQAVSWLIKEALEATFEQRPGHLKLVAAAVRALGDAAPQPAQASDSAMAQAIHYPECWDTAAYPTVESALAEVYAAFRCTNEDTHPQASDRVEQIQPVHPVAGVGTGSYDANDLHAAILNLPPEVDVYESGDYRTGYRIGHRDARHAAAELVASTGADTARHGSDEQELNLESPAVLLVEDQPGGGG